VELVAPQLGFANDANGGVTAAIAVMLPPPNQKTPYAARGKTVEAMNRVRLRTTLIKNSLNNRFA
jgi:hypothetical protein